MSKLVAILIAFFFATIATSQQLKFADLTWPPTLPGGKSIAVDPADLFLEQDPRSDYQVSKDILVAKTPPKIEFLYFPGQAYVPELWPNWSDGTTKGTKYYTAISDHSAPNGTAQINEYDSKGKQLRLLIDLRTFLEEPGKNRIPPGVDYIPYPKGAFTKLELFVK